MDEPLVNFDNILNQAVESAERPKPIPPGHYECTVGKYKFVSSKKGDPMVVIEFHVVNPGQDIDPTALAEFGGIQNAQKFPLNKNFMLTAELIWRLADFLEKTCKLNASGGISYTELLPQTENKKVLVKAGPRADGSQFSDVLGFLPLQEA